MKELRLADGSILAVGKPVVTTEAAETRELAEGMDPACRCLPMEPARSARCLFLSILARTPAAS